MRKDETDPFITMLIKRYKEAKLNDNCVILDLYEMEEIFKRLGNTAKRKL